MKAEIKKVDTRVLLNLMPDTPKELKLLKEFLGEFPNKPWDNITISRIAKINGPRKTKND